MRLAVSAFAALRAFVPPAADAHSPALRASAAAAAGTAAAVSSALPAIAGDEYLNYNMTGGVWGSDGSLQHVKLMEQEKNLILWPLWLGDEGGS